jgi:hypothetical protein
MYHDRHPTFWPDLLQVLTCSGITTEGTNPQNAHGIYGTLHVYLDDVTQFWKSIIVWRSTNTLKPLQTGTRKKPMIKLRYMLLLSDDNYIYSHEPIG